MTFMGNSFPVFTVVTSDTLATALLAGLVGRFGAGFAATFRIGVDFSDRVVLAMTSAKPFCCGFLPKVILANTVSSLNDINNIKVYSSILDCQGLSWTEPAAFASQEADLICVPRWLVTKL
jgi:hypothetical protein